jgi:hypothetical protein
MIVVDGEEAMEECEEKLGLSVAGWGPSSALASEETKSARCTTLPLFTHNHTT